MTSKLRAAALVASVLALLPVAYVSWQQPITTIALPLGEEDDCPLTSATGFGLDAVTRVSPTLIVCEYGKGWAL